MDKENPVRERFLPIVPEDQENAGSIENDERGNQRDEQVTADDEGLENQLPPGCVARKRKGHMRVSFNERVTDLATQEEYARYFEAYVTRCYNGCFDRTPSCGIRVRTDTKSWVVRRPIAQLEALRQMLLDNITAPEPPWNSTKEQTPTKVYDDEEDVSPCKTPAQLDPEGKLGADEGEVYPEVGLCIDSTSEFILCVLRDWKLVKAIAAEQISHLFGFSNHAGGVHNYHPWLPTIEERYKRRIEAKVRLYLCHHAETNVVIVSG